MYKLFLTFIVLLLPIKASALIIVAFPTSIPDKCYVALYDDSYNPITTGLIDCRGLNPNNDFLQVYAINQNYKLLPEWKKKFPKSKFEQATVRNASKAEIEKEVLAIEDMYQEISSSSGGVESGRFNLEINLADLLIKFDGNLSQLNELPGIKTRSGILIDFEDDAIKDNPKPADSLQTKANINTSRSNTKGVMAGDINLGESDSLKAKADHNSTRSNQSGIKDIDTSAKDSLTQRSGTNSNPYFVSSELAGDMVTISNQSGNNSTDGSITHFFLSKIKEVKNGTDMRGRDYALYKDGKQFYYDATNNELKVIYEALKKASTNEKAAGCPPAGLTDCTPKGGFCWCYLRASRSSIRQQ